MRTLIAILGLVAGVAHAARDDLEISVVVDQATIEHYGSPAQARAAVDAAVSWAAVTYKSELGLNLHVGYYDMGGPVPGHTSAQFLIDDLDAYWKTGDHPKYSAHVLFTTRELTLNGARLGGIAHIASICTNFAGAVVKLRDNGLDGTVVAHELGHVLGAQHDAGPGYVMAEIGEYEHFSPESLATIADTVKRYGSCLGGVASAPTTIAPAAPQQTAGGGALDWLSVALLVACVAYAGARRRAGA